jgi:hypothetical protein
MYYPLLVQDPISDAAESSACTNLCNLWITIFICAFSFYDVMMGYSSSPCYAADIPTYPFSLQIWLHISGYMGFTLIAFHTLYQYRDISIYRRTIILCHDVLILLMFMWNIMGTIILWLHYADYVTCSMDIVIYMCIRLSVGIVINFLQLYLDYRQLQL